MYKTVKIYRLFIAAPGDVFSMIRVHITNAVVEWNKTHGEAKNLRIEIKEWTTDSFPVVGRSPEASIIEQVFNGSAIVVPVFWTRFGAPTGKAGSGTAEEVELAFKRKIPCMLYFCDIPVKPSELNEKQYRKVKQFRRKHSDKSLYHTFCSEEEFGKIFRMHLSALMLSLQRRKLRIVRRKKRMK